MKDYAIIMAGGIGERLWPLSRKSKPKQLLKLFSDKTMIEETIARIEDMIPIERVLIVSGKEMKDMIKETVPRLKDENFLVEPKRKNTASAILYAANYLLGKEEDAMMFVLTSDHFIKPVDRFLESLKLAKEVAMTDKLVLLGIEPSRPETGYGYIETGEQMDEFDSNDVYKVKAFKEKPQRHIADKYYIDSKHLWNSGMFIWKASSIAREANVCAPKLATEFDKYRESVESPDSQKTLEDVFDRAEKVSIDSGVMEKACNVAVVRAKFIWDDMGSFIALPRIYGSDGNGNTVIGEAKNYRSFQTVVYNKTDKPIVTFGLSDAIIVRTDDVLLIMSSHEHSKVGELVKKIKENGELEEYM
ncbi:MAG: mannose-1-phosphate guanylyltransferase [Candidatus Zixiibacteriota bacterium]